MKTGYALLAGALICTACVTRNDQAIPTASVCTLNEQGSGEIVIQGKFVTDRFHEPLLVDPACPGKSLIVHLPEEDDKAQAIRDLGWAIFEGPGLAVFYMKARGTFSVQGERNVFSVSEVQELFRLE